MLSRLPARSQLGLVPYPSPAPLGHVPVERWWQVSGSVPARLGCLIQAGLSECTAAGRHSAAPRAGQTDRRRGLSAASAGKLPLTRGGDRPLRPPPSSPKKLTLKSSSLTEVNIGNTRTSPSHKSQNTKEAMFPEWTVEKIPRGSGHICEEQHGRTLNIHWLLAICSVYLRILSQRLSDMIGMLCP